MIGGGPVAVAVSQSLVKYPLADHTDYGCKHHRKDITMACRARYDDEEFIGKLEDVESDNNVDEPVCPGSNDEFPYPDSSDDR